MNIVRCAFALVCLVLISAGAFAQANPPQAPVKPQPATAQATEAVLASARQLVAAAQPQEAITQLNSLLVRDPVNRAAVQLKTSILLDGQRFDQALAVYDSYVAALRKPDPGVLALVARAELRRLLRQQQSEPIFVAAALERLARDGDAAALQDLKQAAVRTSPESPEGVAALSGLVKLGDKDAIEKLGSLLGSAWAMETRVHLLQVIRETDARALAPKVAALLGDESPQIRAAAALTVGVLQVKESAPRLQALLQDEVPLVRIYAAIALKRLGQPTTDTSVAGLLKSEVPEAKLMAAEAYQTSKSTEWIPAIKSLLGDRDEMTRLRAADLLACCDQASARTALVGALDNPNQLIRNEAARILEARGLADPTVARRLLGDPFEGVRLHGAGATLLAVAAPSR